MRDILPTDTPNQGRQKINRGYRNARFLGGGRGAVVFTLDDGYAVWDTLSAAAAERGQKLTLALQTDRVGSTVASWATVQGWINNGHEVASHTHTHANLTGQTVAQRVTEYENSRALIIANTSLDRVTTFVPPFGLTGRNAQVDQELYLRYDRSLITSSLSRNEFIVPMGTLFGGGYHRSGRLLWTNTNTNAIEQYVRLAATNPVIVNIFTHEPGGSGGGANPTVNEVLSILDLAESLGVPLITASEALPGNSLVADPSFELQANLDATSNFGPWYFINGGGTNPAAAIVSTEPIADGIAGTKCLRLSSGGGTPFVSQAITVLPNTTYRLSARYKRNLSAGTFYFRARPFNAEGTGAGDAGANVTTGTTLTSTTWAQGVLTFTTGSTAVYALVEFIAENATGEVFVDHVHVAPNTVTPLG